MADNKSKEDFPGYPHYPKKEDIMNSKENKKVDVNIEDVPRANNLTAAELPENTTSIPPVDQEVSEENIAEADVTAEEKSLLQATAGEDVENATGDELDIPGSEDDDKDEEIGEEDEENNYYSLGGDSHDNLEESRS
jgi:hypothetical protein